MEEAFGVVLFGVVIVGVIVALATFASSGRAYDHIGRGGLSLNDGTDRPAGEPDPASAAGLRIRDDEIRQMLEARNERRLRRGQEPIDVEAELAELTATRTQVDPGLREEIRQLVEARNARRVRRGKEPLDVEAEVEREIRALEG